MAMNEPGHDPADVATGLMLQIVQQAERLALLEQRETGHCRELTQRLDDLSKQLTEVTQQADAVHDLACRQAALLETLDGLDQQLAALTTRLTQTTARANRDESSETHQATPAPRWWNLDGAERDESLSRLRAWVDQVYRPGYGHLSATLGPCWDQHPLCLYGLDWLMELWSAFYLSTDREHPDLASQAEWQIRLLPTLAEQLHQETTRCEHDRLASRTRAQGIVNSLNQTTS
jgi:hypothetical protein